MGESAPGPKWMTKATQWPKVTWVRLAMKVAVLADSVSSLPSGWKRALNGK